MFPESTILVNAAELIVTGKVPCKACRGTERSKVCRGYIKVNSHKQPLAHCDDTLVKDGPWHTFLEELVQDITRCEVALLSGFKEYHRPDGRTILDSIDKAELIPSNDVYGDGPERSRTRLEVRDWVDNDSELARMLEVLEHQLLEFVAFLGMNGVEVAKYVRPDHHPLFASIMIWMSEFMRKAELVR
jgi:hypothetical protein